MTYEVRLGGAINQDQPELHPGDTDDCVAVAANQAARAVGGAVVTVPQFRSAAGRPDVQGQSNGMTVDDLMKAALKLWPKLRITKSSPQWNTFRVAVKDQGRVFAIAVLNDKLPKNMRYGFVSRPGQPALHEISGRYVKTTSGGQWYVITPLQPKGSNAFPISEAVLKAAVMATGHVSAALFAPAPPAPEPAPDPVPTPDPTPAPTPLPAGTFNQADLDAARAEGTRTGYNVGYAAGTADTKAAAHITYG